MKSRKKGNTLILVLACIGILVCLVAFFVLNYNQIFGTQKQVASAIDAAALAAAVDIGRVVVDTPLGRVALVDDVPAVASSAPPSNGTNTSTMATDPRPIQGINTIMGTLRLDAVIAGALGNTSISFLVGQDLARAQEAASTLNSAINNAASTSGGAYDKFGNQINIPNDVQAAYSANTPKLSRNSQAMTAAAISTVPIKNVAGTPNSIGFELGYLTTSVASTNIPTPQVPQATSYDPQTTGITVYAPYHAYPAPNFATGGTINALFTPGPGMSASGLPGSFQFAAIANQPALIDKSSYYGTSAPVTTYAPASAVHVRAYQNSAPMLPGTTSSQGIVVDSYAEAGGAANTQSLTWFDGLMQKAYAQSGSVAGPPVTPSGTLEVSFASGGIPGMPSPLPSNLPAAPNNQKLQLSNTGGGTATTQGAVLSSIFSTPKTIMSASTLDMNGNLVGSDYPWTQTKGGTAQEAGSGQAMGSGVTGYKTATSPGYWYVTKDGPVPAVGNGSSSVIQQNFKGLGTQTGIGPGGNVNPSIALSYLVYDWLKTLGLRPGIQSVVDALTLNTSASTPAMPASTFYSFEPLLTGTSGSSWTPQNYAITFNGNNKSSPADDFYNHLANNNNWTPPAYADATSGAPGIINALEDFHYGHGDKDPRSLTNAPSNPDGTQRQQANVWGYVPADVVIPDNAMLIKTADGDPLTTDGNTMNHLYKLWSALIVSSKIANSTQANAWGIIQKKLKALDDQNPQFVSLSQQKAQLAQQLASATGDTSGLKAQMQSIDQQLESITRGNLPQVLAQVPRAQAALINSRYCNSVIGGILKNMKALTALGCKKVSKTHYILGGADFWPVFQAATVAELNGTTAAPDGQDPSLQFTDWCTPPSGKNTSQLNFYKHTTAPVIGNRAGNGGHWLTPAMAVTPPQGPPPYNNLHFCFYVTGSDAGKGVVHLYVGADPFANASGSPLGTLEGQALYQDTQALQTNPTVISVPTTGTALDQVILQAAMSGQAVAEIPTYNVSSYTVWQVQARDQAANSYATLSSSPSTANPAADYFANSSLSYGPQSENNQGWCGLASQNPFASSWQTPQCPALSAEWQLTCPMTTTFDWTSYTPYTMPPVSIQLTQPATSPDYTTTSMTWNGVGVPLDYTCGPDYLSFVSQQSGIPLGQVDQGYGWFPVDQVQTQVGTGFTGTPELYQVGGLYFYAGPVPGGTAIGNGWYLSSSPYTGSYYTSYQYVTTVYAHS